MPDLYLEACLQKNNFHLTRILINYPLNNWLNISKNTVTILLLSK